MTTFGEALKPGRFANTQVKADDLARLGTFVTELTSLKNSEVAS
jgi:hypothetical protein